jgi:hypothetical protein
MNRVLRIVVALACLVLLSQLMAYAGVVVNATVFVDDGTNAWDWDSTAAGSVSSTLGKAQVIVTADNTTTHAVINTAPVSGTAWTTINGGAVLNNGTTINDSLTIDAATTINGGTTVNGGTTFNGGVGFNGGVAFSNGASVTGGTTLDSLDVIGNAVIGGTLGVTGATTLTGALTANGGATVNNGFSAFSGVGTGDRVVINATSANIGNATSGLTVTDATNAVSLVSDNDLLGTNARAALNMSPTSASLLVNTSAGVPHGLSISQTATVLSGGTNSTTLTLDNSGATFQDTVTGGPALVHGVADAQAPFDAVNLRQLGRGLATLDDRLSGGIASVAALAAIPGPVGCKNYSLGIGFGEYSGQSAGAIGVKANLPKSNISLAAGAGFTNSTSPTFNGGVAFSF